MNDLIERLNNISSWNSFAASLVSQSKTRGLTQRQIDAAETMLKKLDGRAANRAAKSGTVTLDRIMEMFSVQGSKRAKFYADGLVISTSRHPDTLYVVEIDNDVYQGKIVNGNFQAVADANPTTLPRLRKIAENPRDAAVAYGRETGICSCCGRELTNKTSIEMGIGPICASKWGF